MPKRGREKDEYPEWIREQATLTLLNPAANASVVSNVQLQDWVLPVELDLTNPTFIELNSLTAWIDAEDSQGPITGTFDAYEMALDRLVHVYVMNERRTAEPSLADNAVIAHFVLNHRLTYTRNTISASAANGTCLDLSHSELRGHREYEDSRTGQGLLITQPRIFLLFLERNSQGETDFAHTDQTHVGLKMTFRLTDRVSSKEFFTEMIAKFS